MAKESEDAKPDIQTLASTSSSASLVKTDANTDNKTMTTQPSSSPKSTLSKSSQSPSPGIKTSTKSKPKSKPTDRAKLDLTDKDLRSEHVRFVKKRLEPKSNPEGDVPPIMENHNETKISQTSNQVDEPHATTEAQVHTSDREVKAPISVPTDLSGDNVTTHPRSNSKRVKEKNKYSPIDVDGPTMDHACKMSRIDCSSSDVMVAISKEEEEDPNEYLELSSRKLQEYSAKCARKPPATSRYWDYIDYRMETCIGEAYTSVQIDSGSQCNLISENVMDAAIPEWRNLPAAKMRKIRSLTKDSVNVFDAKMVVIRFAPNIRPVLLKLNIMRIPDEFLLGAGFLAQLGLILDCSRYIDHRLTFPPELSYSKESVDVSLSSNNKYGLTTTVKQTRVEPHSSSQILVGAPPGDNFFIVSHHNGYLAEKVIVNPTLSPAQDGCASVLITNNTDHPVIIPPDYSTFDMELVDEDDYEIAAPAALSPAGLDGLAHDVTTLLANHQSPLAFPFADTSRRVGVHTSFANHLANKKSFSTKNSSQNDRKSKSEIRIKKASISNETGTNKKEDSPPEDIEESEDEDEVPVTREDLEETTILQMTDGEEIPEDKGDLTYEEVYKNTDPLDFNQSIPGEDGLIDLELYHKLYPQPIDKIPWKDINPQYHGPLRYLFTEKYPKLLARHNMDVGNASPNLGMYQYISLKAAPPKSKKVYHVSPEDTMRIKDLMGGMCKAGLLSSCIGTGGSPIFLIPRKNPQSPSRLLVAFQSLNEVLVDIDSPLPHTQRMVECLAKDGLGLASVIDFQAGFYNLRIAPEHRLRMVLNTTFGMFKSHCVQMGLKSSPQFFQTAVFKCINTKPEDGTPDYEEHVWGYLDDVPIMTPPEEDEKELFIKHYIVLDRICGKLDHHGFKVSPSKLVLCQKKVTILGLEVEGRTIKIAPPRVDKMRALQFPKSRLEAQKVCGFLSSLKHFSPLPLQKCHAILSELTRATDKYKFEDKHRRAFDEMKRIITTEPFMLSTPNPRKVKLLYSDSSTLSTGAILYEVDMDVEVQKIGAEFPEVVKPLDPMSSLASFVALNDLIISENYVPKPDGNSWYRAIGDQILHFKMTQYPWVFTEVRTSIMSHADFHPSKLEWEQKLREDGWDWNRFMKTAASLKSGLDRWGILQTATAYMMDRHLFVIRVPAGPPPFLEITWGGLDAHLKPPFWLAAIEDPKSGDWHYQSLLNHSPNRFTKFTSFDKVKRDIKQMTQEQIFEVVKAKMNGKSDASIKIQPIAYHSRPISEIDRKRPIHELELHGLLDSLNTFRPYLETAPTTIVMIDSRTVYFLFYSGYHQSAVKMRRYSVLVELKFPNLLFKMVGTKDNHADILTRMFDVPNTEDLYAPEGVLIGPLRPIPELDGKFMSAAEIRAYAKEHPEALQPTKAHKKVDTSDLHLMSIEPEQKPQMTGPEDIEELKSKVCRVSEQSQWMEPEPDPPDKDWLRSSVAVQTDPPWLDYYERLDPSVNRITHTWREDDGVNKPMLNLEEIVQIQKEALHMSHERTEATNSLTFSLQEEFTPSHAIKEAEILTKEASNTPDTFEDHSKNDWEVTCKKASFSTKNSLELFAEPIKILSDRLKLPDIRHKQVDEMSDLLKDLKESENSKVKDFVLNAELIYWKDKIYLPPSLEPIAIAYVHLVLGHVGRHKMEQHMLERFYFPKLREKVGHFTRACVCCSARNPLRGRKSQLGVYPTSSLPWHTVFLDLSEDHPDNKSGIKHFLIATDYSTQNVLCFGLKTKKGREIVEQLKVFLMHTNMATKYFITDNGTPFRNKEFLSFTAALNIMVPATTPYSSRSRGAVEISIQCLNLIVDKMLINSPNRDVSDIYWMAAVLLNNSYHPAIKGIPSKLLHLQNPLLDSGSLSAFDQPMRYSDLVTPDLVKLAEDYQKFMKRRVQEARKLLMDYRKKRHDQFNKNKLERHGFEEGQIVFVKNFQKPPTGASTKHWPKFQKSPFLVIGVASTTVLASRLVDGYTIKVRTDYIRAYKPHDAAVADLPDAVKAIVGSGLSVENLINLARTDSLDLIMTDFNLADRSALTETMVTRSRSRGTATDQEQEELRDIDVDLDFDPILTDMLDDNLVEELNEDSENELGPVTTVPRRVTFSPHVDVRLI